MSIQNMIKSIDSGLFEIKESTLATKYLLSEQTKALPQKFGNDEDAFNKQTTTVVNKEKGKVKLLEQKLA